MLKNMRLSGLSCFFSGLVCVDVQGFGTGESWGFFFFKHFFLAIGFRGTLRMRRYSQILEEPRKNINALPDGWTWERFKAPFESLLLLVSPFTATGGPPELRDPSV